MRAKNNKNNSTLRLDTADGDIIGTVDLSGKGGEGWSAYADYEGNLTKPVTGVHILVLELVVSNDHGNAFNINHVNLVGDGTAPVGVASTAIAATTKATAAATASTTTAKASATATKSTATSQTSKASATSASGENKGSSITPFIIGGIAVVVIAGGITAYIMLKKKKLS